MAIENLLSLISESSNTTVTTPTGQQVTFGPAEIQALLAKVAVKENKSKAIRGAQQGARQILGDGLSDLAKICRKVVTASGENAEGRIAEMVLALQAVAEGYLNTK